MIATKTATKKMTDAEYKIRRTRINEQTGARQERVDKAIMHRDAYHDQELAKLFYDSGWTQQELADREGKERKWVERRLRLSRFLIWRETANGPSGTIPKNLTERRFRSYWEQTSGTKDTARFRKVMELVKEGEGYHTPRDKTLEKIEKHCKSGEWYTAAEVVALRYAARTRPPGFVRWPASGRSRLS